MSIIWGIPYLLIKIAVEGVSVPVLVFARTAVGAAVLLPLALSSGIPAMIRRHWKALLGFSFFEIIAAWYLLSDAERHLTSSMTGLLIAAAPIIAAVLDRFTGGEQRLGLRRVVGLSVGLAGVAVLAGPHLTGGTAWPIVEVLMVATCYAIAPLIAARHLSDVPALPMGLAVICTALAFIVFFALIREVGAARALVFTYVNPAVALLAGVVVLSEPLTAWNVGALVLILAGCVLATHRPGEPAPDSQCDEHVAR
jgi:drug/metabolite transporter (DMT)-like permease